MTNENGPTRGIVDIETFGYYVVGYVSAMLASRSRTISPNQRLMHYIFPDKDPLVLLRLKGIPWDDVPDSLQKVLLLQYDSASLPGEKTVDTNVRPTGISLRLKEDELH